MDLTFFGEDGAAAPAAEGAGSAMAETGAAPAAEAPQAQNVSPRIASEMKRQMAAHPEKYGQQNAAAKPQADAKAVQTDPEKAA